MSLDTDESGQIVLKDPFPSDINSKLIAPWPTIDRFPFIIGANLTGQYLSTAYRLGTTGWRYQLVDLLDELLEHDGHARGVTRQRALAVAGARIQVGAPRLPPNHKDEKLANEIAEQFDFEFTSIPALSQALGRLNWAMLYGLSASEIDWQRTENWQVGGLSHIHTRRLNYSDSQSWDLYIYDQGLGGQWGGQQFPYSTPYNQPRVRSSMFGLRIADYPGKFLVHSPALSGQYPTRDGEGRHIGIYMLLKRMVLRASAQDFERTIRPWVIGYFSRKQDVAGAKMPFATPEDIEKLDLVINALGTGSMNSGVLSDACKVDVLRAASAMNATEFITFLNQEISKSILGQAFTTEPGANGNFATAETANKNTLKILAYDAGTLADSVELGLARTWLRLRYPEADWRLCPKIKLLVDELPDAATIMSVASKGASIDMPIDVDKLGELTNLPMCPPKDGEETPRRTRMAAAGRELAPPPEGQAPELEQQQAAPIPDGKKLNGKAKALPVPEPS